MGKHKYITSDAAHAMASKALKAGEISSEEFDEYVAFLLTATDPISVYKKGREVRYRLAPRVCLFAVGTVTRFNPNARSEPNFTLEIFPACLWLLNETDGQHA
jgi:hypothetical protein